MYSKYFSMSLEFEVFIFRNVQKVDIITVKNVFRRIAQSTKRIKVDYSGSAWIIRMSRAHVLASSTTNDSRTDIATEALCMPRERSQRSATSADSRED